LILSGRLRGPRHPVATFFFFFFTTTSVLGSLKGCHGRAGTLAGLAGFFSATLGFGSRLRFRLSVELAALALPVPPVLPVLVAALALAAALTLGLVSKSSLYFRLGARVRGRGAVDRRPRPAVLLTVASLFVRSEGFSPMDLTAGLLGGLLVGLETNWPQRDFKWLPSSHGRLNIAPQHVQLRPDDAGARAAAGAAAATLAAAASEAAPAATDPCKSPASSSQRCLRIAVLRPVLKVIALRAQRPSPSLATS